jgi:hypothetical protein
MNTMLHASTNLNFLDDLVTSKRLYPDFDIDQCYSHQGTTCDVIRVVIEVGSLLKGATTQLLDVAQVETLSSLKKYLKAVGNRAHGSLLGIAIVANTVCLVPFYSDGWMKRDLDFGAKWSDVGDTSVIIVNVDKNNAARLIWTTTSRATMKEASATENNYQCEDLYLT